MARTRRGKRENEWGRSRGGGEGVRMVKGRGIDREDSDHVFS